ncbi:hypothetical protein EF53_147 [Enterococcus phage 53]|uniref:hypothetical protein n=1 Tax=Enterococcus phage 53 TaxID=3028143 RepID=UPI0040338C5A|nr:hypothetical protein EF53_147 [Enterococcus phage 53]
MTEFANMNKEEVLELLNDWFGVSDYDTVMEELGEMKQVTFTGSTNRPLLGGNNDLIGLPQFFKDNEAESELPTYEELLEELEKDTWNLEAEDNTYNYGGFLERDMDFKVIQAENSDTTIAFFAIHTGVDVRAGYSKAIPVIFETYYDFEEFLGNYFYSQGYYEFKHDNKEYTISLDVSAVSEYVRIYIADENNEELQQVYEQETCMDLDKESVAEYLEWQKIEFKDLKPAL